MYSKERSIAGCVGSSAARVYHVASSIVSDSIEGMVDSGGRVLASPTVDEAYSPSQWGSPKSAQCPHLQDWWQSLTTNTSTRNSVNGVPPRSVIEDLMKSRWVGADEVGAIADPSGDKGAKKPGEGGPA
ncbi:hypothetical protein B0H12DRAFT_1074014 [Mycena haematopus]|nr:hypothetical protein B0H12DRAFT_1074014 [Mycena haematopus]